MTQALSRMKRSWNQVFYTILYYSIPYYLISFYAIPFHTILYYTIPFHTMPYYTILYYTIPFHTIPYYTILYYTIPFHNIPFHTIPFHFVYISQILCEYQCHTSLSSTSDYLRLGFILLCYLIFTFPLFISLSTFCFHNL